MCGGRTLLLPMARLPSSTVAQTLVKGLQVASQQGAIPVRCFYMFLLWLVQLTLPFTPQQQTPFQF